MSECCIKFREPVSRGTVNQLVIEYLKYILYYRGQFPLPLDQLKRATDADSLTETVPVKIDNHTIYSDCSNHEDKSSSVIPKSNVAKDRTRRIFKDTINTFDGFFKDLLTILEDKDVLEVIMNLGPNMMSPKELHRITLPNQCTCSECSENLASFQRCRLQFFQKIMHKNLLENPISDNPLPISFLLLLRTGVTLTEHMEQKRFYAPPKKCKQVTVRFDDSCNHVPRTDFQEPHDGLVTETQSTTKSPSNGLWVKLKPELRGFKAHKSFSAL